MLELPPDLENQLREQAARHGQDMANYLRLILNQQTGFSIEAKRLNPEDYPREGENWTEEDLQVDLDWATSGQARNE